MCQRHRVGIELHERLVLQVLYFVDVTSVHLQLEEVVKVVAHQVVVIIGKDILLRNIWSNLIELYPEHRELKNAAILVHAVQNRAQSINA